MTEGDRFNGWTETGGAVTGGTASGLTGATPGPLVEGGDATNGLVLDDGGVVDEEPGLVVPGAGRNPPRGPDAGGPDAEDRPSEEILTAAPTPAVTNRRAMTAPSTTNGAPAS